MKVLSIITFCLFISCKSENKLKVHKKLENYVNENFSSYEHIYYEIEDWIKESNRARRDDLISLVYYPDFEVDKLLLINDQHTKLVGTINMSHAKVKNCTSEYVYMFWGIKLSGKWYFIKGGNLFVPRKHYKYDINKPMKSFQLSFIGRDYFLKHFISINKNSLTVNSELINNHVSIKDGYYYKDNSESNWLKFIENSYSKKVEQEEIVRIQNRISNEIHKDAELPKKGTQAWKELYGNKTPLFEKDEWKKYEEQRNQ